MTEINWEKCIVLANKRLRDVITAANKADNEEMTRLMLSGMCGEVSEFTEHISNEQTELTLNGDQTNGIYFTFKGYNFHITKDSEYNSKFISDLYHIWCECKAFNGEEMPLSLTYVKWLFGGTFLEGKHKAFLTGKITKQEFEQYLWDDVHIHCSDWLEKNKEKISK